MKASKLTLFDMRRFAEAIDGVKRGMVPGSVQLVTVIGSTTLHAKQIISYLEPVFSTCGLQHSAQLEIISVDSLDTSYVAQAYRWLTPRFMVITTDKTVELLHSVLGKGVAHTMLNASLLPVAHILHVQPSSLFFTLQDQETDQ